MFIISIYKKLMESQPIIQQEGEGAQGQMQVEAKDEMEAEEPVKVEAKEEDIKLEIREQNGYVAEVRIGDETLFSLPPEMQQTQNNLVQRQRKTRWGERRIKRSKIQQDAVFNPLESLYHGKTLLPITQYGQAELEIKMSLYSDGKRRKSKWHHEIEKTFNPPLLNYVSPSVSVDEIEYLLRLYRLDELTSQMSHFSMDDPDLRSPSPEPIYDNTGKRINTRQVRKRDNFQRERISLIEDCMKMRKTFVPPDDYKPLKKFKKIYLTDNAIKDTKANYIGKIIGQGGRTQKLIENRSGCKIGVRGRGANKQAKDIFQNYEPLHIIIVADNDEQLDKGVEEVEKILNNQEDQELKELMDSYNTVIQGIFDENYCENCKQEGHRTWACPFQTKAQVNIKCSICGQSSHPTSDCPEKQAYLKKQQTDQIAMLFESQYHQFKEDLNVTKSKGGMAFITDFQRKDIRDMKAITQGQPQAPAEDKNKPIALGAPLSMGPPPKKPEEEKILESDLPKFEDD